MCAVCVWLCVWPKVKKQTSPRIRTNKMRRDPACMPVVMPIYRLIVAFIGLPVPAFGGLLVMPTGKLGWVYIDIPPHIFW